MGAWRRVSGRGQARLRGRSGTWVSRAAPRAGGRRARRRAGAEGPRGEAEGEERHRRDGGAGVVWARGGARVVRGLLPRDGRVGEAAGGGRWGHPARASGGGEAAPRDRSGGRDSGGEVRASLGRSGEAWGAQAAGRAQARGRRRPPRPAILGGCAGGFGRSGSAPAGPGPRGCG